MHVVISINNSFCCSVSLDNGQYGLLLVVQIEFKMIHKCTILINLCAKL